MSGHDDDTDSQRNKGSAGSYQAFDLVGSSRPRVDQPAFNLTYSQAATTVAGSTIGDYKSSMQDSGDDRVSRVSMYTYTSGDAEQFRKQIGGRVSQVVFASASLLLECQISDFSLLYSDVCVMLNVHSLCSSLMS
jgi:hypothetical protein